MSDASPDLKITIPSLKALPNHITDKAHDHPSTSTAKSITNSSRRGDVAAPPVKDFSDNYEISKLIMYLKLKKRISDCKNNLESVSQVSIFSYLSGFVKIDTIDSKAEEKSSVANYWSAKSANKEEEEERKIETPQEHAARQIISAALSVWFHLAKIRKRKHIKNSVSEKTVLVQTAVRRWLARKEVHDRQLQREIALAEFKNFCTALTGPGITLGMFSKTYGTLVTRTIFLDSSHENIVFDVKSKTKIPVRSIYGVNKGQSAFRYRAMPTSPVCCFHLNILGGDIVDFQAKDREQTRFVYNGFSRMILLLFSQSPFYIDHLGIPRRALGSVVQYALEVNDKSSGKLDFLIQRMGIKKKLASENLDTAMTSVTGSAAAFGRASVSNGTVATASKESGGRNGMTFVSVADQMRYRSALRMLMTEYGDWDDQLQREKSEFDARQAHELKRQTSILTTTHAQRNKMNVRNQTVRDHLLHTGSGSGKNASDSEDDGNSESTDGGESRGKAVPRRVKNLLRSGQKLLTQNSIGRLLSNDSEDSIDLDIVRPGTVPETTGSKSALDIADIKETGPLVLVSADKSTIVTNKRYERGERASKEQGGHDQNLHDEEDDDDDSQWVDDSSDDSSEDSNAEIDGYHTPSVGAPMPPSEPRTNSSYQYVRSKNRMETDNSSMRDYIVKSSMNTNNNSKNK